MDKPSQTKPYAGLIIYRINRNNVEYLLLNDSFTNKKHWFCPKGQVLGNEDEIKCALRETFEATGLRPSELRIEEGFAIELKYLSGTKPKKVKYHLAQLLDNHFRLLPNAEGVHMQWFNQSISSEKVIFKSMQDVFKHAQTFVESKRRNNKQHASSFDRHHSNHSNNNNNSTAINSAITAVATPYNHSITTSTSASTAITTANEVKSAVTSTSEDSNNTHNQRASYNNKSRNNQQQQQQQLQQQQASPLYKTRLCERFETEGSCPYGPKCNFAHGIVELRGREAQDAAAAAVPSPTQSNTTAAANTNQMMMDSGNQLFKTRLCEKFMKEKFCQYGPKCHFAHGEHELKERPKKAEDLETARATPPPLPRTRSHNNNNYSENINVDTYDGPDQRTNWRSGNQIEYHNRSTEASWRSNHNVDKPNRTRSPSSEDEVLPNPAVPGRANRDGNWRSTTPTLSSSPKTSPTITHNTAIHVPAPAPTTPPPVVASEKEVGQPIIVKEDPPVQSMVEELRRPAFVEHQIRPSTPPVNKKASTTPTVNNKDKKAMVAPVTTEKSWMKVVKLSREEQDEINAMQQYNSKTCSPGKLAQTESIIADLKKFFLNNVNSTTTTTTTATKGKLMEDVKEVTKIEMRNDLSKKQLLYILLVSLLEDTDSLVPVLKSRNHLFKTLVKTNADQILLLRAWENFVTQRKHIMVNKTAAALSHWYDCEMIEEEAFVQWYDTLEKESALEKKSAKFIEWLNSSDDEEEED